MSTSPSSKQFKVYGTPSEDASLTTFAAAGLTSAEVLDSLFEDDTTFGLGLPTIPERVSSNSPNSTSEPYAQKRKLEIFASDDDFNHGNRHSPDSKKAKNTNTDMENENERKGKEAARLYHNRGVAASTRPSINTSKLFDSMKKEAHIPTPKHVPTSHERRNEIKLLAKQHVRHVAPSMLANNQTNRDVGGRMSKHDWIESKREIPSDQIKAPVYDFKKWVDDENENVTWLIVPVSRKVINAGGSMIQVADVVNDSFKHPEFTFVEAIMGTNAKTGKEVVKAYKLKHEKMDGEQSVLRADAMIKQWKEEEKQSRSDKAARKRRTKQASLSDENLEPRAAVKKQKKKKKARAQAEAEKGGFF